MKFKFFVGVLLCITIGTKGFAQFEMNDMMYQMQRQIYQQNLQRAFSKIESNYSFKSFDGQNVTCIITMARMTGFSDISASIQNRDRTESQNLSVECYNPMSITISAGGSDWNLAYGDRISIIYDGDKSKNLTVGIDDNMSEVDWERYAKQLIRECAFRQSQPDISDRIEGHPNTQYDSNSKDTNQKLKQVPCTSCGGTGISRTATSVPGFGSTELHWCDVCKREVSASHGAHLQCPICSGKGYVERYGY